VISGDRNGLGCRWRRIRDPSELRGRTQCAGNRTSWTTATGLAFLSVVATPTDLGEGSTGEVDLPERAVRIGDVAPSCLKPVCRVQFDLFVPPLEYAAEVPAATVNGVAVPADRLVRTERQVFRLFVAVDTPGTGCLDAVAGHHDIDTLAARFGPRDATIPATALLQAADLDGVEPKPASADVAQDLRPPRPYGDLLPRDSARLASIAVTVALIPVTGQHGIPRVILETIVRYGSAPSDQHHRTPEETGRPSHWRASRTTVPDMKAAAQLPVNGLFNVVSLVLYSKRRTTVRQVHAEGRGMQARAPELATVLGLFVALLTSAAVPHNGPGSRGGDRLRTIRSDRKCYFVLPNAATGSCLDAHWDNGGVNGNSVGCSTGPRGLVWPSPL
jgi:hypothetical protein